MKEMLGKDFDKYVDSLTKNAKKGVRVNKNYINPQKFKEISNFALKDLLEDNLFEIGQDKVGNTVFHHAGMIYVQEPSSMLAVLALDVKNGEKILDLCSAPGGKSSQILEKNPDGIVVSNEIIRSRASVLFSNIERQGFKNSIITSLSREKLAEIFPNYFDKILVDAPCSGEGMFRKDPKTIDEWNANLPLFNHERQLDILKFADLMLKENGAIVYSTCTFNQIENEQTVAEFCNNYGYEIQPLPNEILRVTIPAKNYHNQNTSLCAKCFPFSNFGEGQFISKLVKKSANLSIQNSKKNNKMQKIAQKDMVLCKQFLENTIGRDNFYFYKEGENIFLSEIEMPEISCGVICKGVCLGIIKKDRVEPHHQFFKAYGKDFLNKIDLKSGDQEAELYLKGNEINCEGAQNGYVAILFEGVPLGGGKVSAGKIKNHYPKGLRNNR